MPNNLMCETPKSLDATHQPVVICVDTSASMFEDAGNGMTKIKMVENMINSLANLSGLSETEKNAVDICVLQFNDMVGTVVDWKPLSSFNGGVVLEAGGCTALGSAIFAARDKVRERRYAYNNQNVACRRYSFIQMASAPKIWTLSMQNLRDILIVLNLPPRLSLILSLYRPIMRDE